MGSNSDFKKSNVAAHHAEMGNLPSLNPKMHRLRADPQVHGGVTDSEWKFFPRERCIDEGRCSRDVPRVRLKSAGDHFARHSGACGIHACESEDAVLIGDRSQFPACAAQDHLCIRDRSAPGGGSHRAENISRKDRQAQAAKRNLGNVHFANFW